MGRYKTGAMEGVKYDIVTQDDELIKATVAGPEGNREQLLTTWESANRWINKEVTNIITGGRYATK